MNINKVTLEDFADAEPKLLASATFGRYGKKRMFYIPNLITGQITYKVICEDILAIGRPREEILNVEYTDLQNAIDNYNEY